MLYFLNVNYTYYLVYLLPKNVRNVLTIGFLADKIRNLKKYKSPNLLLQTFQTLAAQHDLLILFRCRRGQA